MYEIKWKGRTVGSASLKKEGLFYRIYCNCELPKPGIYRVTVTDGNGTYSLGVCVPNGGAYSCVARIPCKRLMGSDPSFLLTEGDERLSVPVEAAKPFAHLDKLSAARLRIANGQPEIIIDPVQCPQDNDQNPKHLHK